MVVSTKYAWVHVFNVNCRLPCWPAGLHQGWGVLVDNSEGPWMPDAGQPFESTSYNVNKRLYDYIITKTVITIRNATKSNAACL